MRRRSLIFGIVLIFMAGLIFGTVSFLNSNKKAQTLVYARQAMLRELWDVSKTRKIEASSGRTVDSTRDNITTSEGESYTMLRAVWEDDQPTFKRSWAWTQVNLQRSDDHLFSWEYGKKSDGTYGILVDQGGNNTASDADTDIALALVMAANRWHDTSYLADAKTIIPNIWKQEVVTINAKPVMTADNLERNDTTSVLVNPSYFSPYAYKTFAKIDPTNDWTALTTNSYDVLERSMDSSLDKDSSADLVPNWIRMSRVSGVISAANTNNLDTNYGYDAMRTPFRLALDYAWFKDARDKTLLAKMNVLSTDWTNDGSLASVYTHAGLSVSATEAPAVYGGNIGYFIVVQPKQAEAIYTTKLADLYDANGQDWKSDLSYYDDNWAWFGLALYTNNLTNLTGIK